MSCTFVVVSLESCCVLYVGDFGSIFGAPLFRLLFDAIRVEMRFRGHFRQRNVIESCGTGFPAAQASKTHFHQLDQPH